MTSHSLDPDKIQKMRNHSLQPSSWQFVGPLRSSSFGRDARWNLNLGSRFTKPKKKENDRSYRSPYAQNLERNVRFESKSRPRPRNSKNRWAKPDWRVTFVARRFLKFYSLKQVVTRKRAYPIGDCDNLPGPTYLWLNRHTRSILPILPSPIFKKYGKTGTPTHSFHDSHA